MSWSRNMIQADNMGRPQMTLKDSEILSKTPSDTFWYTLKGITKLWNKFAASSHLILIWLITILFYAVRGIFQPVVVENSFPHILIKFSKLLGNKNERLKAGQLAMVALMRYICSSHIIMHFLRSSHIRFLPKTGFRKSNFISTESSIPHPTHQEIHLSQYIHLPRCYIRL